MKVKLTLAEMFTLHRLIDIVEVVGYKAALTKLFHEMIENEKFADLVADHEQIKANATEVANDYQEERQALISEMSQTGAKTDDDLPEDIRARMNAFNTKLNAKIEERNKELADKVNAQLRDKETVFECSFNKLTRKAINSIAESESKVSDLGLDPATVKTVIDIYLKLEDAEEGQGS